MRMFRWAVAAMIVALLPSLAAAQQTESRVSGKIVDQSQATLPGVTVNVTSKDTGSVRSAVTDSDGMYTVTNLAPGRYTISFDLAGFQARSRDIVLGVGQFENVPMELGVAAISESVHVSAVAPVLDVNSARIGVNVSPDEVANLPVNGRNFANLMTLATGATSDGNGGWASIRFNGKSNQQNYLNYDGVDGTYVWDASPGYLNATGSQFRLQTSMESVAEFRVNSGLASAESGLGSGGNITVVTKSGSNAVPRVGVPLQARRRAGRGKQVRRPEAEAATRAVRRIARRAAREEPDVLLRQLRGAAPDDRPEVHRGGAERRGARAHSRRRTGRQRRRAERQPHAGGGPAARGFPRGTMATANPLVSLRPRHSEATQRENTLSVRIDHRFTDTQSFYVRYLGSKGEVDTPDRTVTPRRVLAEADSRRT